MSPSPRQLEFDIKAIGYLTSIASVLFLGAVAWTKENPPGWYYPALIIGMATSIIGMGFRYAAHLRQKREIERGEDGSRGTLAAAVGAVPAVARVLVGGGDRLRGRLVELHPVAEGQVIDHVHHLELEPARLPRIAVP